MSRSLATLTGFGVVLLWPLLIVLFSGLLPGERLRAGHVRAGHVLGALVSFTGPALIVLRGGAGFLPEALPGGGAGRAGRRHPPGP